MLSRAFTKREKILMTILALMLVVAFYYLVVEQRIGGAIEQAEADIEFYQTENALLQTQKDKIDYMKGQLEIIHQQDDPQIVPPYDNLQQVMLFLNAVLSTTSDYSISFGTAQLPDGGSYIATRSVAINFASPSYPVAKQVVKNLQECPYCCTLQNLNIMPAVSGYAVTEGNVNVSLNVVFYESVM